MLNKSFGEEIPPDVQPAPPLLQLEATSSLPVSGCLGEEANPDLAAPSFQAIVESLKVTPEPPLPPLLHAPSSLSWSSSDCAPGPSQLCCPSLHLLQHLSFL